MNFLFVSDLRFMPLVLMCIFLKEFIIGQPYLSTKSQLYKRFFCDLEGAYSFGRPFSIYYVDHSFRRLIAKKFHLVNQYKKQSF